VAHAAPAEQNDARLGPSESGALDAARLRSAKTSDRDSPRTPAPIPSSRRRDIARKSECDANYGKVSGTCCMAEVLSRCDETAVNRHFPFGLSLEPIQTSSPRQYNNAPILRVSSA
jgi:hypothetical protein